MSNFNWLGNWRWIKTDLEVFSLIFFICQSHVHGISVTQFRFSYDRLCVAKCVYFLVPYSEFHLKMSAILLKLLVATVLAPIAWSGRSSVRLLPFLWLLFRKCRTFCFLEVGIKWWVWNVWHSLWFSFGWLLGFVWLCSVWVLFRAQRLNTWYRRATLLANNCMNILCTLICSYPPQCVVEWLMGVPGICPIDSKFPMLNLHFCISCSTADFYK